MSAEDRPSIAERSRLALSAEDLLIRYPREGLELSAGRGVERSAPVALDDPAAVAHALDHPFHVGLMPALALAEVGGVEMIDIVLPRFDDLTVSVLRDRIAHVHADEVDRVASQPEGELEHVVGNGLAEVDDPIEGSGESWESRVFTPEKVVVDGVGIRPQSVDEIHREKLGHAPQGVDRLGVVGCDEHVLDDVVGRAPRQLLEEQPDRVAAESGFSSKEVEIQLAQAWSVSNDPSSAAAADALQGAKPAQVSGRRPDEEGCTVPQAAQTEDASTQAGYGLQQFTHTFHGVSGAAGGANPEITINGLL